MAADRSFEPAFTADQVDFDQTQQFVNGTATKADPERVKKALGLLPSGGNWEENKWDAGQATEGGETTFAYVVVLKMAVEVGSIAVGPADLGTYRGSQNNGEVWLLKGTVTGAPDSKREQDWEKVVWPTMQPPGMRFHVFAPGTKVRAFLYKDVRVSGRSTVDYWRIFKRRLVNLTVQANGFGPGGDPASIPAGKSWELKDPKPGISDKNPAWYILAWDEPRTLNGIFLYSNIKKLDWSVLKDATKGNPALAPAEAWQPLDAVLEEQDDHVFKHWQYYYRWFGLNGVQTRAIRLRAMGVDGNGLWISGLAAMGDLKDKAAPEAVAREEGPPFRVKLNWPQSGEATLAVDGPDGSRVRNLRALTAVRAGEESWSWDLKDDRGQYVAPGAYKLKGICAPPVELHYGMTPYPNVDQLWPDRTPWLTGHDGANGWLSDHCQNWAITTRGDRMYFGAPMAEAGVCMIECDLDGKKIWGRHDFEAWRGVDALAADEEAVYIDRGDAVYRMDPATREAKKIFQYNNRPDRRGYRSATTAFGGKVCLAFTGEPLIDNALSEQQLDVDRCIPKPGGEILHALRLKDRPPGRDVNPNANKPQGNGKLDLESTMGKEPEQHLVLAFKTPVTIGTMVFPAPEKETTIRFSVLKADAAYPPKEREEVNWRALDLKAGPGWNCLPAPPDTTTRALRVTFSKAGATGEWYGRLEGLKILLRRFGNLSTTAKVRVNSGQVDATTGVWDAQRKEAVWHDKPGVYLMDWAQPQKVVGLAFKEVDGAVVEIDVWQGPVNGEVPMDGPAVGKKSTANGWRNVAQYKQARRSAEYNNENNRFARYVDGNVDFREEIVTRAIRLRVTEQWMDNGEGAACRKHDGRSEHGMHYRDSYAARLDTRLCSILGVAPLQALDGVAPLGGMTYERLEVWDGKTGQLLKEWPVKLGWHGLCFDPDGKLFGIEKRHDDIIEVNLDTGQTRVAIANCSPSVFTIGPDKRFYVRPWTDDGRAPLQVYDAQGKPLHTIGKAGGWKPGPWDPERFGSVHRLCVDKQGSLWVLETDNYPRRILQYKTDGKLVKEILGNTFYGGTGGGTMDRYNAKRAFWGRVEFELDWEKHTSRIRSLLTNDLINPDIVAVRVKDQKATYLTTAPLSLNDRQGVGAVYLYDEAQGTARLVAAMGDATGFQPLRQSGVLSALQGGVLRDYSFVWSDRNANGTAEADEVQFEKKKEKHWNYGVGRFDLDLGSVGGGAWYRVKEFLTDGTPIYERTAMATPAHLRLSDGRWLALHSSSQPNGPSENFVSTAEGKKVWGYPASGGVSGLSITPWQPGLIGNQFGVCGHEIAPAGDLGEFFVVHQNTGQWSVWTSDGLLAGQLLLHKHDGRAKFFGPSSVKPGDRLDPLSANQEHFHGFFTRVEPENRYYLIAGFTHMSILEVKGLERFKRINAEVQVTEQDVARAKDWDAAQSRKRIEQRAMVVQAAKLAKPPKLDGKKNGGEWPVTVKLDEADVSFSIGYDDQNLYLCWTSKGQGELKNSGTEFQRCFKTGACLDFFLGCDATASADRTRPVKGDLRLLLTMAKGKPQVVLYQSVAPGATAGEKWKTFTQAGGETAFDRVVLLSNANLSVSGGGDFTAEASLPKAGQLLKLDWGLLTTSDGNQVKRRMYWANDQSTGTSDEATEARLEPHLWGYVRF
jgi:hypothetical protein